MKQTKIISKWVLASVKIFYRFLAVSAEVFCRHTFGVRYVNDLLISFGIFLLFVFTVGSLSGNKSPFLKIYLALYSVLICYHIVSMFRRQNQAVHSHSIGSPWPFWRHLNLKPMLLNLLVEPGCVWLIGYSLFSRDEVLSLWIQLSALSLLAKRAISEWNKWHHLMDVLDTRIEGERLNEAVRERSAPRARTTSGTTPVSAGQAPEQPRPPGEHSLDSIFGNLDPALRRIFTPSSAEPVSNPSRPVGGNQSQPGSGGPLAHLPRIKSPRN